MAPPQFPHALHSLSTLPPPLTSSPFPASPSSELLLSTPTLSSATQTASADIDRGTPYTTIMTSVVYPSSRSPLATDKNIDTDTPTPTPIPDDSTVGPALSEDMIPERWRARPYNTAHEEGTVGIAFMGGAFVLGVLAILVLSKCQ
ncbi:hypothetical protein BDV95DRAFT_604870 [Massariosphaeria phaeospora]|uniref:Uncharacterized protein n=1 Tax=Massariosphaeria phaeospora TaxID=100035 RepID=A0A7C8MEI7_9PLEO|nr:hypothetical protein BDV95DRAFT_604870 [Massariosphaeria phaeospora]